MSLETPNPQSSPKNPEMYVIPVNSTENEAPRTLIEVTDVPGYEERIEVKHDAASQTQHELGQAAVAHAKEVVTIENPTPQMMRKAIGSPYKQDYQGRLSRVTPEEDQK